VATLDFLHAKVESILIGYHAPAQIHVHEMDPAFEQVFSKPGEDEAHEVVTLRLHVLEGRGNKDADGTPRFCHGSPDLVLNKLSIRRTMVRKPL
jgi:hypothetical protein